MLAVHAAGYKSHLYLDMLPREARRLKSQGMLTIPHLIRLKDDMDLDPQGHLNRIYKVIFKYMMGIPLPGTRVHNPSQETFEHALAKMRNAHKRKLFTLFYEVGGYAVSTSKLYATCIIRNIPDNDKNFGRASAALVKCQSNSS